MFAISTVAIQAQIAFTLDTSAMVVGTTTIDNVDVSYTGSQDALTGVRIDYEQGSSVGTNYLSMPSSGFLFTDTGNGSFNFNIPGLISGQLYTIRAIYCGFGVVTTCPGTIGTFSVTTLGPPTITSPPSNVTVNEGDAASFSVSATGNPSLFTYQWFEGLTATTVTTSMAGEVDSILSFSSVTSVDDKFYKVIVSNSNGATTSNVVRLTVRVAPVITSPPSNVTVNPGDDMFFSVTASGTAPLSYQWRKLGSGIVWGTASSVTFSNVTPADSCTVYVIVSNVVGADTSSNATGAVTLMPPAVSIGTITPSNDGGTVVVTGDGYGLPTKVRLLHGTDSTNLIDVGSGPWSYTFTISGYSTCQTVPLKAEAQSDAGTVQTGTSNLQTNVVAPVVETNDATIVAETSADLNGTWESNGTCAQAVTSTRFNHKKNGSTIVLHTAWLSQGVGSAAATASITGLLANTSYLFQIEGKNANNQTDAGNWISFTTLETPIVYSATVQMNSYPVSNIVATSASGKLNFKASTNDPSGANVWARHSDDAAIGLMAVVDGPITIIGTSLTDYTINLTNLILGDTNFVELYFELNTNGSSGTSAIVSFWVPSGVTAIEEEVGSAAEVKVFPNPATDFVTIETQNKGVLTLSNILGEVVAEKTLSPGVNKLEIMNLSPGLYFYKVGENAGKLIVR